MEFKEVEEAVRETIQLVKSGEIEVKNAVVDLMEFFLQMWGELENVFIHAKILKQQMEVVKNKAKMKKRPLGEIYS